MSTVTLADVRAAHARIRAHIHRTPVLTSRLLDERASSRLFFKCENLQRSGAFKARGAFSRITMLGAAERSRGIVAFSSGNHAQAVALAGRELGAPVTMVMPADAPASKIAATRGYGAEVILYDRARESREGIAARVQAERGGTLVPPFDDDAVIAGQGTAALELLEEVPDLDGLVTPAGGGGLLSGSAVAGRGVRPALLVYGVEPEAGDDLRRSVAAGKPVRIGLPATIADSLQTVEPAERTVRLVRDLCAGIATVSDDELRRAMALLASRMKLVVEPGGSAGFAALLAGRLPELKGRRVGVILSGGNVDPERFGALIAGLEA